MVKLQAICYIIAIILLFLAAFVPITRTPRVSLALLGAAFALLAYAIPTINAI